MWRKRLQNWFKRGPGYDIRWLLANEALVRRAEAIGYRLRVWSELSICPLCAHPFVEIFGHGTTLYACPDCRQTTHGAPLVDVYAFIERFEQRPHELHAMDAKRLIDQLIAEDKSYASRRESYLTLLERIPGGLQELERVRAHTGGYRVAATHRQDCVPISAIVPTGEDDAEEAAPSTLRSARGG